MPSLSTYGGATMAAGYPGQEAETGPSTKRSMINESATAITVGRAVCRGAVSTAGLADNCKPQGADVDVVVGLALKDASFNADINGDVTYARYSAVPVLTDGVMFALAAETTVEGDGVIAITAGAGTLGSTTGGAAGAGRIAVPGAIWLDSVAAAGIGRIRIKNSTT
jgi:hypothetical protein